MTISHAAECDKDARTDSLSGSTVTAATLPGLAAYSSSDSDSDSGGEV